MRYHWDSMVEMLQLLTIAVFMTTTFLGCQSELEQPHPVEANPEAIRQVALGPGDTIELKFFYTPELNETQRVRPDGKIALQLVGEIRVEGKNPAELRSTLMELYKPHLKDPEIAVVVRSLERHEVHVGGKVITPGTIEMPRKMTVLEAIMQAGGFDLQEAELANVVVIRHRNGQRHGYSVNVKAALEGQPIEPFYLEPQDIIYVPQTEIAKLNQWIDQHINKVIPDTGLFFRKTHGNTTVGMGSYR